MSMDEMKKLAEGAVKTALSRGAETAEVSVKKNTEFDVKVRMGNIETLTESRSSSIIINVSLDKRKATVTSSDLSEGSIGQLAAEAVELAGVMDRDEYFGLPDPGELGGRGEELEVFDLETMKITTDEKIKIAVDIEKTACGLDKRIITDRASYSNGEKATAFANSLGFCDGFRRTFNSIDISCAAEDKPSSGENIGKKQSSYWYSSATHIKELESVEEVASRAVERTIRKLGAVKPETCEVPVVFDPLTAQDFLSSVAKAANGGNIYMKSSFLVDRCGERIGSPLVTIIDNPLLRGKLGSRPFDGEGVRSRRNIVIEKGVLKSYLTSSYQARKLGIKTTGSKGGSSNFYMEPGQFGPDEIIASVGNGLYLTSLFGPGANWTTGDFSQGGQGIWIENGKLSYPVNEFTIAGTFQQMLKKIVMVGNDLGWRSEITSPTFKIESMTVSGT